MRMLSCPRLGGFRKRVDNDTQVFDLQAFPNKGRAHLTLGPHLCRRVWADNPHATCRSSRTNLDWDRLGVANIQDTAERSSSLEGSHRTEDKVRHMMVVAAADHTTIAHEIVILLFVAE